MALPTIPGGGKGKWRAMRVSQMSLMQSQHGGAKDNPTLNGIDALRIIGYWWRQRGRFWQGWVTCFRELEGTGLKPTQSTAFRVFTPAQSKIVWDCAAEAAEELSTFSTSKNLPPQDFTDRQSIADAKEVAKRFLASDFKSKIPAPLPEMAKIRRRKRKPPIPKIPPDIPEDIIDKIPKPRIPRLKIPPIAWLLLLAVIVGDD